MRRILYFFTHILLLITTPALLAAPSMTVSAKKLSGKFKKPEKYSLVTYDEILTLLVEIETGRAEKKYSSKEIKRINRFLAHMAKEGASTQSADLYVLNADIQDLLGENTLTTGICCRAWFNAPWSKTKKFVKRHKKELIIGAAIVVAAAVVVVVIAAPPTAAAIGSAGGAIIPSVQTDKVAKSTDEAPILKEVIDTQAVSFKEFMEEDRQLELSGLIEPQSEQTLGEKAREFGAFLAHQTLEEVSELVSVVPRLCEEIRDVGTRINPENSPPTIQDFPLMEATENYQNLIASGHQAIDRAFSTDQSELYDPDDKIAFLSDSFTQGILPPPTGVPSLFSNSNLLIKAGRVLDRAGFTKAGRALMKHGYRKGSVFPKPYGSPEQINAQGQQMLESIVTHPEKQIIPSISRNCGEVVDVCIPGQYGARFHANGEFITFLEP